jgi:hypothetical protein
MVNRLTPTWFLAVVTDEGRREDFQGDIAIQPFVMGTIRHSHSASSDRLNDSVVAEDVARVLARCSH